MTAYEIRETELCTGWNTSELAIGESIFQMLREIAAQLAELNERLTRSDAGQAIAEFAVLLPVFVLIGFGIVDIQWMTRDAQAIEYIATESARCEAIKAASCANESQTAEFALQLARNVHLPIIKDQIATPVCNALTCSVIINFPFKPLGVWFPSVTINRTGQAAVQPGG